MFGLILLSLAVVGGLGGWFVGSLKRRRWWPAVVWVPLPFWLYLPLTAFAVFTEGGQGFVWWLIGLAMLGFPILAWAIPAGFAFAVARYGDQMAGNLRAP